MDNKDAEKQTHGKRTIQKEDVSSGNSGCSTGIDANSNPTGSESFRPIGEDRKEGNKTQPVICTTVGKLIDRLIDSWKDREQEANDCLDWYNNQVSRCQKEIKLLESMKEDLLEESVAE